MSYGVSDKKTYTFKSNTKNKVEVSNRVRKYFIFLSQVRANPMNKQDGICLHLSDRKSMSYTEATIENSVTSITVDIADMVVSNRPGDKLITYSLGSCIGLAVWDPQVRAGGLLHYMLPDSSVSPDKAKDKPFMFADTGIPLLFKSVYKIGGDKKRLIVKVAGGSQMMDSKGVFNIGKRNYMVLRKLLWKNNVIIDAEDVGGFESRTMSLDIATGLVTIKKNKRIIEL